MATKDSKAARKDIALKELDRMSTLLSETFDIEVPDVRPTHRDAELQSIQRIEGINELLKKILTSSGVDLDPPKENEGPKLGSMTKAELLSLAVERKVEVAKSAKKAEIIEALNA